MVVNSHNAVGIVSNEAISADTLHPIRCSAEQSVLPITKETWRLLDALNHAGNVSFLPFHTVTHT